jgi:hypothetical protein
MLDIRYNPGQSQIQSSGVAFRGTDVHQGMREPHFRSIDDTIARAFQERQKRLEFGFQDEFI